MGYAKSVYAKAAEILKERKSAAIEAANIKKNTLRAKIPEYKAVTDEMRSIGLSIARAAFGDNPKADIAELREKSLACQALAREILRKNGYDEDCTEVKYYCGKCKDTGFVNGSVCSCHKALLCETAKKELGKCAPVKDCTFSNFDLSFYDSITDEDGEYIGEYMSDIYRFCKCYAEDFGEASPSLFMYGKTGLGKTHLSIAIAGTVIEKGYGVIYASAQNLIAGLENARFGRTNNFYSESALLNCDLLIIDDLGAELNNQFSISEIYNIVNTRLSSGKPTIISTNLDIRGIEARYTERISSRIMGEYQMIKFYGTDIRVKKNNE